jgi:hypothetical protein
MVPVVRPSPVLAGCAALAVVLATGCGTRNGGDVKPDGDAQAVCSTLLAWRQRVPADSARLSAELQAGSLDAQPVKDRYTAFFQAVVGRTDTMLTGIDKAGAPKVDNGAAYARELRAALTEARSKLADARARLSALPAGDLRPYAAGAATIRDQLGPVFTDIGTTLDRLGRSYPDKALNGAFDRQQECTRLG